MTRTLFLLTSPLLFLWAVCSTARAGETDTGKQMYRQYCASCHGIEGTGNGAVAKQLKIKVADLTLVRKKNKGVYPLDNVMATIDGRRIVKGHGDREMPVWGEVFAKEREKEKYTELTTLLKAKIIAEYVATLQK
jgi:mono/diheme cytochrome c family protein